MTIRDPIKFCSGLWDWEILDGCFGDTLIKPTDCEGLVERRGWFLYIETKAPGAGIPAGQSILFQSLVRTGRFTVVVVWGETNMPTEVQVLTRHKTHDKETCDLKRFREIVSSWFSFADKEEKF